MKVSFSQELKDLDGKILIEQDSSPKKPITLRTLAVNSLMAFNEKDLSGEEKVKRYDLSLFIHHTGQEAVDMSVEDVALIKGQIGRMYSPLLVGQAWKMLDSGLSGD